MTQTSPKQSQTVRRLRRRGLEARSTHPQGYASMSDDLKERLNKNSAVTLTILFDDAQTCEDFAEFGEVVLLEDICN